MDANRRLEYDLVYMKMATCLRPLSYAIRGKVGCIIVSDTDQIIAQGYNGMPKGYPNECEYGIWDETEKCTKLVTKPEVLHAESNAIAKCAKWEASCEGGTAYVTLSPCLQCSKLLVQSGIKRVVFMEEYRDMSPIKFLLVGGVKVQKLDMLNKKLIDCTYDENTSRLYIDNKSYLVQSF